MEPFKPTKFFPAIFQDVFGTEYVILETDGTEIEMEVRGVRLDGSCFEEWELVEGQEADGKFVLLFDKIEFQRIEVRIPTKVMNDEAVIPATLVAIAEPEIDHLEQLRPQMKFELIIDGEVPIRSSRNRWPDLGIDELQGWTGSHGTIKCCRNCLFSQPKNYLGGFPIQKSCHVTANTAKYMAAIMQGFNLNDIYAIPDGNGEPHLWEWKFLFWHCERFRDRKAWPSLL